MDKHTCTDDHTMLRVQHCSFPYTPVFLTCWLLTYSTICSAWNRFGFSLSSQLKIKHIVWCSNYITVKCALLREKVHYIITDNDSNMCKAFLVLEELATDVNMDSVVLVISEMTWRLPI